MTGRPRHGGNLRWAAGLAGCEPGQLLDFSASISPLGPPPAVLTAIQGAMDQLGSYPDPDYALLRTALGRFHGVDPAMILPGNGAAELLTWAGRDLAACQQTLLLAPSFGDYGRSLRAFGARVTPWPLALGDDAPKTGAAQAQDAAEADQGNLKALARQLTARDGLLLNNPHNPTGLLFRREAVGALLETGAMVVVDEAFMDFVAPGQQQTVIDWLGDYDNLVVLRSLTKFYRLPGLRLGYALGAPQRLQRWQQWRDPWPVNSLAAAAAIAALSATDFAQRTWDWLGPAREALFAGLAQLDGLVPLPGMANFLLVRCRVSVLALQAQLLQQERILIRDCLSFGELGDRYFRVAVRLPEENQRLLAALAKVLRSIQGGQ